MKPFPVHIGVLYLMSPPVRGAWIETGIVLHITYLSWSPPVRGAWIETISHSPIPLPITVAPRAGGVD